MIAVHIVPPPSEGDAPSTSLPRATTSDKTKRALAAKDFVHALQQYLRIFKVFSKKPIDKPKMLCYNNAAERYGPVAQLVRALACHARGRGFEPHPSRHFRHASVAQLVEQGTENPRVVGSIPTGGTI